MGGVEYRRGNDRETRRDEMYFYDDMSHDEEEEDDDDDEISFLSVVAPLPPYGDPFSSPFSISLSVQCPAFLRSLLTTSQSKLNSIPIGLFPPVPVQGNLHHPPFFIFVFLAAGKKAMTLN